MLTLENRGIPIAKIVDSKHYPKKNGKSKFLALIPEEDIKKSDKPAQCDPYLLLTEDDIEKEKNTRDFNKVRSTIRDKIKKKEIPNLGKEIIMMDGEFEPIPNITKERDVIFAAGPSGSGKSTILAKYLANYVEMYPNNRVILFSMVESDPAFEFLGDKLMSIKLDKHYMEDVEAGEEITMEDLRDAAVIFDDIDVISCKKLGAHITNLRNQCLEIGRHYNATTLCTAHQLCNYRATKILLQEATKVVLFPRSGSTYHIKRFLKEYCGLPFPKIEKIINLPSRWVMVSKEYPQYILSKDQAYTL